MVFKSLLVLGAVRNYEIQEENVRLWILNRL